MFDEIDLSDTDTQKAIAIAGIVEIIYLASVTQSGMGWDTFPLYLKIMIGVLIPPVMFLVAQKMLNK